MYIYTHTVSPQCVNSGVSNLQISNREHWHTKLAKQYFSEPQSNRLCNLRMARRRNPGTLRGCVAGMDAHVAKL